MHMHTYANSYICNKCKIIETNTTTYMYVLIERLTLMYACINTLYCLLWLIRVTLLWSQLAS